MVATSKSDGLYLYGSNTRKDAILSIIRKKIGRKKSGSFKLHLISGRPEHLPAVASDICIKFVSRTDDLVTCEDPPTLDDLLFADLPWSGEFIINDDTLDRKYGFTVAVKNILRFNKFIFQLRETNDGKHYQDGLVKWTIYNSPEGFDYDIKTGLKQMEVVETFQRYYDGVETLKQYLGGLGYEEQSNEEFVLKDDVDNIVSTIDYTLLGVLFFESVKPKVATLIG